MIWITSQMKWWLYCWLYCVKCIVMDRKGNKYNFFNKFYLSYYPRCKISNAFTKFFILIFKNYIWEILWCSLISSEFNFLTEWIWTWNDSKNHFSWLRFIYTDGCNVNMQVRIFLSWRNLIIMIEGETFLRYLHILTFWSDKM